jgi:hypothetical protein
MVSLSYFTRNYFEKLIKGINDKNYALTRIQFNILRGIDQQ